MLSEFFAVGGNVLPEGGAFFETGGFTHLVTQESSFLNTISSSDNSTPQSKTYDDVDAMDERKRRRMISNRESARRSRKRKQKHLENLRDQLNRLKTGNRDLMNRLRMANLYGKLVRQENQKLVSESVTLQRKLRDISRAMHVRQLNNQLLTSAWPCNNNVPYIYEQIPPSLII